LHVGPTPQQVESLPDVGCVGNRDEDVPPRAQSSKQLNHKTAWGGVKILQHIVQHHHVEKIIVELKATTLYKDFHIQSKSFNEVPKPHTIALSPIPWVSKVVASGTLVSQGRQNRDLVARSAAKIKDTAIFGQVVHYGLGDGSIDTIDILRKPLERKAFPYSRYSLYYWVTHVFYPPKRLRLEVYFLVDESNLINLTA
jgi:hypothetical protein